MAKLTLNPTSARRLDAYRVTLELIAVVTPLLARIIQRDPELGRQLKRALPSVGQHIAEGMRRTGRDRAHLLTIALGSADEVRAIIDIATMMQILTVEEAAKADELADRICAMVYRIRQRQA
jgi:four helix bundle protein